MLITCKTVTDLHTAAREGALGWWYRLVYRSHMKLCPYCQSYEEGLSQTIDALASLPKEPSPESAKKAALAKLLAKSSG